ncbi:MAG TPA: hypothetical protein H9718_03405 [Candidatus Limosilactobacillus gallistercoris]|nr:hypothetical protein [Candidatus Limosilactobacillus gallistercoris]
MLNTKQKMVASNVFHRLGIATLITIAWVVGFELVIDLLGLIFNRNLMSFLVSLQGIPESLVTFLPAILVIYFLVTPYGDFKWAIQNGISRSTLWQGRLVALVLSTLLVYLIDELLTMTYRPFGGWREVLVNFTAFLTVVLTCQAIGNGFSLLDRKWKVIVGIGLPVMLIILMMMLLSGLSALSDSIFLPTYQHNHFVGPLAWLFNITMAPATPWIIWGIYLIIIIFLTKFFNDRLQLRRD